MLEFLVKDQGRPEGRESPSRGLHRPLALGGLQHAEDADQAAQEDGYKEEDEDNPGAEAGALPEGGLFRRDHVGEVQHVAQGPADGRVPGLLLEGYAGESGVAEGVAPDEQQRDVGGHRAVVLQKGLQFWPLLEQLTPRGGTDDLRTFYEVIWSGYLSLHH
uniref:Uncharacterized protein n=1 Tax=Micrurus lemniscatus lemniscatus TaxID=129467 RepID=A0A2D4I1N2_MICLE